MLVERFDEAVPHVAHPVGVELGEALRVAGKASPCVFLHGDRLGTRRHEEVVLIRFVIVLEVVRQ